VGELAFSSDALFLLVSGA